jgi:hypothetical protein
LSYFKTSSVEKSFQVKNGSLKVYGMRIKIDLKKKKKGGLARSKLIILDFDDIRSPKVVKAGSYSSCGVDDMYFTNFGPKGSRS